MSSDLSSLDPIPALVSMIRAQSPEGIAATPQRFSRAPGRLDVMGGIAEYTGSLVCQLPLDCAVAAALQQREDRLFKVFSYNLVEEAKPAAYQISLDDLAIDTADSLRNALANSPNKWAANIVGCMFVLHEQR